MAHNLSIELTIPLIILVGILSSFLASLIGLGGGITAVPFIMLIIGDHSLEAKLIAYASISFLSIIASYKYYKLKRKPKIKEALLIIFGLVPATVVSVLFLGPLFSEGETKNYFHLLYAMVVIIAMILVNLKDKITLKNKMPNWSLPIAGLFIGVLSGSAGISGGVVFIPLLVIGLKEKLKDAAVTSLVLKFTASIANIITGAADGQFAAFESNGVYWYLPLIIIIGSFIGSQFGPMANKKITNKQMSILFNIVMTIILVYEISKFTIGIA